MSAHLQILTIGTLALTSGCNQHHPATTVKARPVATAVAQKLSGVQVRVNLFGSIEEAGPENNGTGRNFLVKVKLPHGVAPQAQVGQFLSVRLPLLMNHSQEARVSRASDGVFELMLLNQIHDLSGQVAKLEVGIKSNDLYQVPLSAIYSPLGRKTYLFIVESQKARLRDIELIAPIEEQNAIVKTKDLKPREKVVVKGIDNLTDGDSVEIGGL